jgi:hypothetical protein
MAAASRCAMPSNMACRSSAELRFSHRGNAHSRNLGEVDIRPVDRHYHRAGPENDQDHMCKGIFSK